MQKLDLVKETDSSSLGAVKEYNIVLQLSPDLIEFVVKETVEMCVCFMPLFQMIPL